MRSVLLAVLVLIPTVCEAQIFRNAPWNRSAQSGCYTDSNGNTVCPGAAKSVTYSYPSVSSAPMQSPAYYPAVSSTTSYSSTGGSTGTIVSYGSTGSAVVATPTKAPDPNEVSILSRRSDFRQAFLKAVKQARQDDKITALQHGRLVVASLRPRELANIQAFLHENAVQEGLATPAAIDWDNLIDFIERIIPLILQLIDLFS
jgi:hypothetical protein